jgi:hypothetical protein
MKTILLVTSAMLVLPLGCGGDGGGGGTTPTGGQSGSNGTVSSGIDGSKKVSALTPAENQKLCKAGEQFLAANPAAGAGACKLAAVFLAAFTSPKSDAEAQMMCKQAYDDCVSKPAMIKCEQQPATCTATVAQVEACWSAAPAWLVSSTATIPSCNTLKLSDLAASSGGGSGPPAPAACMAIGDLDCPGLDITEM